MHRRIPRSWLLALFAVLIALLPLPALADPGIQFEIAATPTRAVFSGSLSGDDDEVRRRTVVAFIDGVEVATTRTRGNGRFSLEAEVQLAPGRHTATVALDGGTGLAAVDFTVRESDAGDRPAGSTATQRPTAVKVKLTASGPTSAVNGEMIDISGRVSAGDGALSGAGISLSDASGEVPDSFVVSGSDGRFQTLYFVPDDQAEGEMVISLTFAASGGYASARASVTVSVIRLDDPVATPTVTAGASPTPSPSPTATPSEPTPTPSPTATGEAAPPEDAERGGMSPTWIILGLGGMAALLTTSAIVVAARRGWLLQRGDGASSEPGPGGLDLLEDPEDAPPPRRASPS